MKTQHTIGPWSFTPRGPFQCQHIVNPEGKTVAKAWDFEEAEANASLIAAAPDLYKAARHVVMEWRLHGQLTDSCRALESAIAKAESK